MASGRFPALDPFGEPLKGCDRSTKAGTKLSPGCEIGVFCKFSRDWQFINEVLCVQQAYNHTDVCSWCFATKDARDLNSSALLKLKVLLNSVPTPIGPHPSMVGSGNTGGGGKGDGNSGGGKADGKGDGKGDSQAMATAVARAESQREELLYELFQLWREATAREAPM